MITLIEPGNRERHHALLEGAYRLRHAVFVEEMGWENLRRADGREIDRFDTDDIVEMVVEVDGAVVGYQRLLPTMQPYLLSDVYPHLCDEAPPRDPALYEWTRFAVAKEHRGEGRSLGPVALDLVTSFVEWGLASGVNAVVVEMSPVQLLRFVTCRFRTYPLGVAHQIGGEEIIAIRAAFDERTLERLRFFRMNDAPVLDVTARRVGAR